jgi:hypothetical protein
MADSDNSDPGRPDRSEEAERDRLLIPDEAAAEAASADLTERTAALPDPDPARAWWAWWRVQGQPALTRLLSTEWNPIGFDDLPDDEYESYAMRLGDLLREGIPEDEIVAFLSQTRTGALGLPASADDDRRVAAQVHAWYFEARRAAE